jgi:DNA polymerase III delta prime subunit
VIFLGPQGVGKTTIASILQRRLKAVGKRVSIINGDQANTFHNIYIKTLSSLKYIKERFYEDQDPVKRPDPNILTRLHLLDVLLGFIGHFLAFFRITLHLVVNDVVIEHEGFTFKFLVNYIYTHLVYVRSRLSICNGKYMRSVIRASVWMLKVLIKTLSNLARIFNVHTFIVLMPLPEYRELVKRYKKDQRPVEPYEYISMQYEFLRLILAWLHGNVRNTHISIFVCPVQDDLHNGL